MDTQLPEFGLWFREYREAAGYSQDKLAIVLGTSRSTISSWEYNGSRPKKSMIKPICSALGIDESEFLNMLSRKRANVREQRDDDPIVFPAMIVSADKRIGCSICESNAFETCSFLAHDGLPVLCEAVTERDVQGAWASGGFDRLMESRALTCAIE